MAAVLHLLSTIQQYPMQMFSTALHDGMPAVKTCTGVTGQVKAAVPVQQQCSVNPRAGRGLTAVLQNQQILHCRSLQFWVEAKHVAGQDRAGQGRKGQIIPLPLPFPQPPANTAESYLVARSQRCAQNRAQSSSQSPPGRCRLWC